jgi:membrane associated rhomboid family serine protease
MDEDPKNSNPDKIIHFPTLAERDRMRKEEIAREKAQDKMRKKSSAAPFFNAKKIPPFTRVLVGIFVVVHIILHLVLPAETKVEALFALGFVPGYFTGKFMEFGWLPMLGPVTHIFIHGNLMHLAFNTVMTLALGMFFETRYGTRRMIIFFFTCAFAGAAFFFALNPFSNQPVVGASAGLSGLFGALLYLMQEQNPRGRGPWPLVIGWGILMILMGMFSGGSIAWQAHIGGYAAGVLMIYLMQKGKLRL